MSFRKVYQLEYTCQRVRVYEYMSIVVITLEIMAMANAMTHVHNRQSHVTSKCREFWEVEITRQTSLKESYREAGRVRIRLCWTAFRKSDRERSITWMWDAEIKLQRIKKTVAITQQFARNILCTDDLILKQLWTLAFRITRLLPWKCPCWYQNS